MTFRLLKSKRRSNANPDLIKMTNNGKQTYLSIGTNIAQKCNISAGDKVEIHWGENENAGKAKILKGSGEDGTRASLSGNKVRVTFSIVPDDIAVFKQTTVEHTIEGDAAIINYPLLDQQTIEAAPV